MYITSHTRIENKTTILSIAIVVRSTLLRRPRLRQYRAGQFGDQLCGGRGRLRHQLAMVRVVRVAKVRHVVVLVAVLQLLRVRVVRVRV